MMHEVPWSADVLDIILGSILQGSRIIIEDWKAAREQMELCCYNVRNNRIVNPQMLVNHSHTRMPITGCKSWVVPHGRLPIPQVLRF